MDALSSTRIGSDAPSQWPALPPDAPLMMPAQSLNVPYQAPDDGVHAAPRALAEAASLGMRRFTLLVATLLMTGFGAHEMFLVLNVAGLTALECVVLILFLPLFAWVAFSFITNLAGFVCALRHKDSGDGSDPLPLDQTSESTLDLSSDQPFDLHDTTRARTALLFPVYNEEPPEVFGRLQAIYESLAETRALDAFDFFVLSDTTRAQVWLAEEAVFAQVRENVQGHTRIFYRHRRPNLGRKAGNIADWVERFGGRYRYMIVLDADSVMTARTLQRMVALMDRHPDTGLLQSLPAIVNGSTGFARLQQFANRLYGTMLGFGLAWWHGTESNYWGHNAIIRTRAFAETAGLPVLPGRKPFGGEIMSHDFVEAALMRRAGWSVRIAPELRGSFEEAPPALSDYAVRDRRWCQGNLQHVGVLRARGLHPISRLHLLIGIGAYITAPLWLLFLLGGILIALQAQFVRPEYFPEGFALFPQWPAQDPVRAAWVFVATMGLLVLPKLLAWLWLLSRPALRRSFGGGPASLASVFVETLIAGLMAPVMMLNQSVTVAATLLGRDVGWSVQRRDDGALRWRDVARGYAWHTLLGVTLAIAAYAVSLSLFLWMTPVVLGLVLSIPLAKLTSDTRFGQGLRRVGLLRIPEEISPPSVLSRAESIADSLAHLGPSDDLLARLQGDPALVDLHASMVESRPRRRGDVDAELVVALARLDDARTPQEARELLSDREFYTILSDRRGFDRLAALFRAGSGFDPKGSEDPESTTPHPVVDRQPVPSS